jgi:hypothetical protein
MSQPEWGFWIFVALTLVFLGFQVLENIIAHRQLKTPELVCLGFAIICGLAAYVMMVLESGVGT